MYTKQEEICYTAQKRLLFIPIIWITQNIIKIILKVYP